MIKSSAIFWKNINGVVGAQWGDEGKGKIIDEGAQYVDMVVRYSGGPNAGHTVNNKHGEFKLHLIPSGIFNTKVLCIIADGVVIDPLKLAIELKELLAKKISITPKNLRIAKNAHMIMPWHVKRDLLSEVARGGKKIGTTGSGIGPTYSDRTSRTGLRMGDLLDANFETLINSELKWQDKLVALMSENLGKLNKEDRSKLEEKLNRLPHSKKELLKKLQEAKKILKPFITNVLPIIHKYKDTKKSILAEGAQGALLDLDLGNYPYVTSSHPGIVGFTISTGIHDHEIKNVIGVTKAYATRVGSGPMPTELDNKTGAYFQRVGNEFGATTGRLRRCGWFDVPATKKGFEITGARSVALTKVDILDGLPTIKICTAYKVQGKIYKTLPTAESEFIERAKPIYEIVQGWNADSTKAKTFKELPINCQKYILRIETLLGKPVDIISVGSSREATIYR